MAPHLGEKIREYKTVIDQQNGMISGYQREKSENSKVIQTLYTAICQYKVEYAENVAPITEHQYPELKMEDMRTMTAVQLLARVGEAMATVCKTLGETSHELRSAYHEMDITMETSLNQFRTLQANETAQRKGQAFLGSGVSTPQKERPQTPEIPMVSRPRVDSASVASEDPVLSPTGKENKQQSASGKSKAGKGKPLDKVLNSLAGDQSTKK